MQQIFKRIRMVIGIIIFLPVYIYMGIKWIITWEWELEIPKSIKPLVMKLDKIFFK